MTEPSMLISDRPTPQAKPQLTAAHKTLLERKVLPLSSLLHGVYYNGLLDDMTTIGRWHAQKRRFVFWEQNLETPKAKSAPHVADLGAGPRFAPLSKQESAAGPHISDFAFETTR
jgi:hypothetical protein